MRALRLHTDRLGEVREIARYLIYIENAYNRLYVLDLAVAEVQKRYEGEVYSAGWRLGRSKPAPRVLRIGKPDRILLPGDRLRLSAVFIHSPGFWEFAGALNPLETIRKYINDRHERKKDEAYRTRLEADRLRLENEKLKLDVVKEKVDILRSIGIPDERIRETLNSHVFEPFAQIDAAQDAGLVIDAEIVETGGGDEPRPTA